MKPGAAILGALLWWLFFVSLYASDQPPMLDLETPDVPTAPVMLDGRVLFSIRGISAYPAAERAATISSRLKSLADEANASSESLSIVQTDSHTAIKLGDQIVMGVYDLDATFEGVNPETLAQVYKTKIATALRSYHSDREPRRLLKNTGYASIGGLLVLALALVIRRLSRRLEARMETRYRKKIQDIRIQSLQILQAERLWSTLRGSFRTLRHLSILVIFLLYVDLVLSLYPWTRPITEQGVALLLDPLRTIAMGIVQALPDLIFIAILILVIRYFLKLARLLFSGIEHGTIQVSGFESDWAAPTYKIVRLLVVAFGVVVAYPYIPGADSAAFKGVSVFLGIVFSLGSSSTISNIIAGYTMTYRRAFKVGDRVQIGDVIGEVAEVRLQVTHVRSLKNEEVIIPNSWILNSHVINYSSLARRHGLILHTTVGIGYETPWRQVESMLLLAAERTTGILLDPAPFVLQKSLGDFCVTYELNVYSDSPKDSPKLYTELHRNILDVFNEYGVQIMTPAYEGDPEQPKLVPKEKWFDPPARLAEDQVDQAV